jgi:hypothetical protein
VAAFLPGDVVTLVLETLPLYVLYEASILVASLVWRRDAAAREREGSSGPPQDPPPPPDKPSEPTVQDMIDHVDPRLQG